MMLVGNPELGRYRSMPVDASLSLPSDDAEMLEQHLEADEDQNHAARNLRRLLPFGAERVADMQPDG